MTLGGHRRFEAATIDELRRHLKEHPAETAEAALRA
jgi:hypothetical protein